jgi:hypothetical protein
MNKLNNRRCVVLLPPNLYFVRLYDEIIAPAIRDAGVAPALIEHDASHPLSMDALAKRIEEAEVLLADLSENTAEVWFAIGCAVALDRPLCLISSEPMFPTALALMQAQVITYPADAFPSDYIELQHGITHLLQESIPPVAPAQIEPAPLEPVLPEPLSVPSPTFPSQSISSERFRSDVFSSPVRFAAPSDDLVSYEIMALTIIYLKSTPSGMSPRTLGLEMQARDSAHLTSHAMNALKRRKFIERRPVEVTEGSGTIISDNIFITVLGEAWLIHHGKRATSHRQEDSGKAKLINNL